ncbi:MAG TPA: MFS transporter [Sandaracinaceae bacterium]
MTERERFLTKPFALAALANLLHGLAVNVYLHLPGYLETELSADELAVGAIFGAMSGAAIAVRPLAGRVMDASGRRIVIVAGGVVHVVACALYLTVSSLGPWLVVVRSLQGIAIGSLYSSLFTFAADIVPASRRTEGIGIFGVSGMLPISLGGLLGDFVLSYGSYRELFAVSAVVALAALAASLPLEEPARPRGAAGVGFFGALRQRDLVPIWLIGTLFAMGLAGTYTFVKSFVEELSSGSVGLFFSTYAGAAIVLRVSFGWLPDRVGPTRALHPAILSISLALVVLTFARDGFALAVAGVFAGLGHGFAFPILSALVVTRAHPSDRGSAVALFTAIFDAGLFAGGPLLGVVARAADLRTMFAVAAVLPVAGALAFRALDREAPAAVAE